MLLPWGAPARAQTAGLLIQPARLLPDPVGVAGVGVRLFQLRRGELHRDMQRHDAVTHDIGVGWTITDQLLKALGPL